MTKRWLGLRKGSLVLSMEVRWRSQAEKSTPSPLGCVFSYYNYEIVCLANSQQGVLPQFSKDNSLFNHDNVAPRKVLPIQQLLVKHNAAIVVFSRYDLLWFFLFLKHEEMKRPSKIDNRYVCWHYYIISDTFLQEMGYIIVGGKFQTEEGWGDFQYWSENFHNITNKNYNFLP